MPFDIMEVFKGKIFYTLSTIMVLCSLSVYAQTPKDFSILKPSDGQVFGSTISDERYNLVGLMAKTEGVSLFANDCCYKGTFKAIIVLQYENGNSFNIGDNVEVSYSAVNEQGENQSGKLNILHDATRNITVAQEILFPGQVFDFATLKNIKVSFSNLKGQYAQSDKVHITFKAIEKLYEENSSATTSPKKTLTPTEIAGLDLLAIKKPNGQDKNSTHIDDGQLNLLWDVKLVNNPENIAKYIDAVVLEYIFIDSKIEHSALNYDVGDVFQYEEQLRQRFGTSNRIVIKSTNGQDSYKLPLFYPEGKLYIRIAAMVSLGNKRSYKTAYSSPIVIDIDETNGFQLDRNWSASRIIDNRGKQKVMMTHYNKMMEKQQDITYLNTDDNTIIQPHTFDYEGRASLRFLPIIEDRFNIHYRSNYIKQKGKALEEKFYDDTERSPIDEENGGSYYSSNNTINSDYKDGIPDAKGYPYGQIYYTYDKTNRPNIVYQPGLVFNQRSKTSRYFYGNANEIELQTLFGNKGLSFNGAVYKKDLIMDPNGQVSVTYKDLKGKTVATALAGKSPDQLTPLNSSDLSKFDSKVYPLLNSENNTYNPDMYGKAVSTKVSSVQAGTSFKLTYEFENDPTVHFCELCQYAALIEVRDTCGDIVKGTLTINENMTTDAKLVYDDKIQGCTDKDGNLTVIFEFVSDQIGDYSISKTINLTQQSRAAIKNTKLAELKEPYERDRGLAMPFYIDDTEIDCEALGEMKLSQEEKINVFTKTLTNSCETTLNLIVKRVKVNNPDATQETIEKEVHQDPEYCLYEHCLSMIPSKVFDNMMTTAEGAERNNYFNPAGFLKTELEAFPGSNERRNNSIIGGIYRDPFFFIVDTKSDSKVLYQPLDASKQFDINRKHYLYYLKKRIKNYKPESANKGVNIYDFSFDNNNEYQKFVGIYLSLKRKYYRELEREACPNATGLSKAQMGDFPEEKSVEEQLEWAENKFNEYIKNGQIDYDKQINAILDKAPCGDGLLDDNKQTQDILKNHLRLYFQDQQKRLTHLASDAFKQEVVSKITTSKGYDDIIKEYGKIGVPGTIWADDIVEPNPNEHLVAFYDAIYDLCGYDDGNPPTSYLIQTSEGFCYPKQIIEPQTTRLGKCINWSHERKTVFSLRSVHEPYATITYEGCSYNFLSERISPDNVPVRERRYSLDRNYFYQKSGKLSVSISKDNTKIIVTYMPLRLVGGSSLIDCYSRRDGSLTRGYGFNIRSRIRFEGETDFEREQILWTGSGPITRTFDINKFANKTIRVREGFLLPDMPDHPPIGVGYVSNAYQLTRSSVVINSKCLEYEKIINPEKRYYKLECKNQNSSPHDILEAYKTNCQARKEALATINFDNQVDRNVRNQLENLPNIYKETCFSENVKETLNIEYRNSEYNHTLYYYDQAGNLISTVPPKGVNTETQDHTYHSGYQYNAQNQIIKSYVPDHSGDDPTTTMYYDALSQLRFAQNPKQRSNKTYSYTRYDELGRVIESGEMIYAELLDSKNYKYDLSYPKIEDVDGFQQVMFNVYDRFDIDSSLEKYKPYFTKDFENWKAHIKEPLEDATNSKSFKIENGRNRIVASFKILGLQEEYEYGAATFYAYDTQGNVKQVLKVLPNMEGKSLNYDYDIISGNVNQVDYQLGHTDQFSHRYFYDADNRLKEVQTSTDGFVWMDEAQYFYYPHGPLAKVVNGNLEHPVQQQDYHYTLQGWLKGVNQFEFAPNSGFGTQAAQQNQIPTDVYDYSLGYYSGDFESVTGAQPKQKISHEVLKVKDLYNGNIRWMQTDLSALSKNKEATQTNLVRTFEYDQLQRIKASQSWTVKEDVPTATANLWRTNYSFDPNGNIEHLSRYNGKGELVDDLVYNYEANTNKLIRVGNESMLASSIVNTKTINSSPQSTEDKSVNHLVIEDAGVESGTETVQAYESTTQKSGFEVKKDTRFKATLVKNAAFLEDQPANNYEYDESGNMIRDRGGNVDTVIWTLDHKVAAIIKEEGRSKVLFDYDELGNRVRKRYLLKQAEGSYKVEKDLQYIYDVRGNMLAIYDQQFLKEQNIFGTSRLGTYKTTQKTKGERQVCDAEEAGKVIFGNRTYEMTNHLGNVMVTVSDRVKKENGAFDAVVISAQDYYPYGLMMTGRRYSNGENSYRFGFQGQEEDDETSLVNYKYRMHNPRIGRFFSVDPLAPKYPHNSPYAFSENDVIASVELEGLEKAPAQNRTYDQGIRDGRKEVLQNYQKDKEQTKWYTYLFSLTDLYNSTMRRVDAITDYAKHPPQDEYEEARMVTKVKYTTFMNEVDGVLSKSEMFAEGFALATSWFGSATIKGAWKPAVKVISKEVVENSAARGGQSFKSFSAFKRVLGSAGKGKAWHHIVEQNPANIAKFGPEAIHNTGNLMKLPHGAGTIHAKISGHYSSIQGFTGGKTVRQWLNTKSFDFQRNYGLQKLKEFGWTP